MNAVRTESVERLSADPNVENTDAHTLREKLFDLVSFTARFYLAYVWIAAGLYKILENDVEVAQSILAYDIFTLKWSFFLGQLIGPLELAGGLLLLLGLFQRSSAKVSAVVLVLFIVGIAQAWLRGMDLTCGCFGAEDVTNYPKMYFDTIVRDICFIALSIWLVFRPYRRFSLHP